ncbi:MAG TPA: response regulator [Polyangiaceae bacterium]|nr:response regulator [Polyangiaceae bacterium]
MTERKQIGKILLRQRALTPDQLERALTENKGGRLASRLAAEGTITDLSALKALSEQHGIPGIDLGQICLRLETLDLLPREIAEKHLILPVLMREDRLFVATANPREHKVLDELEFVTGKKVYPYVALESSLSVVIEQAYTRKARGEAFYVGSQCPQAMLDKLGIDRDGQPLVPDQEPNTEPDSQRALHGPGVVVDDEVGRLSQSDDIEERDIDALQREDSVVEPIPEEQLRESAVPPLPPGAKTILIVDDELEIRRMLSRLLAKSGYRVLEADRGVTALRVVKEQTPDLIVLDAMLPELHGFDVARRIKGSKRYGSIPIVMVSAVYRGWRYAEDLRQTLGVDEFIEKPFTLQHVLGRIQALLGTKLPSENPPEEPSSIPDTSAEVERCLTQGIEAYKAGRLDEAVEHLRRGVAIDPLAFRLRFQLGLLYGRKGQVFDAVSELETAVGLNPQHFPAVKNLAILYQKAGFRNKAVETWERALALAPDDATRVSIREHLLKLL